MVMDHDTGFFEISETWKRTWGDTGEKFFFVRHNVIRKWYSCTWGA